MPVDTTNQRVIMLPKEQIVTAREYPMTERTSAQLRQARDRFIAQIKDKTGEEVSLPFPTVLAYVMEDYAELRGLGDGNDNKA